MALHENVRLLSCRVKVVNGVPGAIVDRFCRRQTTTPGSEEMITHVPGAAGAPAEGILGMKADTAPFAASTGFVVTSYVPPDGGEAVIELGEVVTQGAKLRIGGNSTEVDGAAYLADASGDYIVGTAAEAGVVGQKIRFQFLNQGLLP